MTLAPRTWSTLSALFLGFVGGALFMALVNGPTVVHVNQVQAPATHAAVAPVPLSPQPIMEPVRDYATPPPAWPVDGRVASLSISKTRLAPGQQVVVTVHAPMVLPRDAWIGVIPSHVVHGSEAVNDQHDLSYQYLEGRQQGVFVFTAPDTPGSYDLRLHSTDRNGAELASVSFQVAGF